METKRIRRLSQESSAQQADSVPNPKWEIFARRLAAGASKTDAYLAAGYKTTRESASSRSTKLAKEPWVRARVRALLAARQRALHGWDAEAAGLAPLEDAQWERFAQNLAAGASQTEAYLAAGYKADRTIAWSAAAQLAKKPLIAKRVEDLLTARLRVQNNWDAQAAQLADRPLKNARREVFSQNLAAGQAQTDAFIAAGYKGGKRGGWSRAGAVVRRKGVRERLTALHKAQLRHLGDELKKSGTETLETAMQERRFEPALQALRRMAKATGC
jgi:hypothetical protein